MTTHWCYLSWPLYPAAPAYGGSQGFFDEPDKQMANGDSCNTRQWHMSNHMGTHIDFPRHFSEDGKTCDDYTAEFWIFENCAVLDLISVNPGHIITFDNVNLEIIPSNITLLMLKTGFCNQRNQPLYFEKNPGLHPGLAHILRERFDRLRVIGFDFISASSYAHRETGRLAHRAFLDHDRPILLLEDMDLRHVTGSTMIKKVVIAPLRVKEADAGPCTVMGEVIQ